MSQLSQQTIESQDLTIAKLFDDFYHIPNYQREYVWQEKQVEQLLKDIYAEFLPIGCQDKSDDYFIGSIVVCSGSDNTDDLYEVIDGQQRITTIYIFFCVVKNYICQLNNNQSVDNIKKYISGTDTDSKGYSVSRYKVKLQYEDSSNILETFAQDNLDLSQIELENDSIKNLVNAYETIDKFLNTEFQENEHELRRFYSHFIKKVKLVRVKTTDVPHALRVFETINDRGVGLNPMDLLKNLMFKQTNSNDFEKLSKKWKEIIDILESTNTKPFSFLRYFIISHYDVKREDVQKKEYEWLLNNESVCDYNNKAIEFVEKIRLAAQAYSLFLDGKNQDKTVNRYLDNIKYLTRNTRQHLSLLLAAKDLPNDCFIELCHHIENLLFWLTFTKQKTNEFERYFIDLAGKIRSVEDIDDLKNFIINNINPIKQKLKVKFENNFLSCKQSDLQKYRVKYILAKITQYIQEKALGSEAPITELNTFIKSSVEIEHILPETPTEKIVNDFDKPTEIKKYIYQLGNLTLLEKSINASIKNMPFSNKRDAYKQSNFYLTKSIAEEIKVGKDTAIDRAVEELKEFQTWNSQSIEERQKTLTDIAKKVWDMEEINVKSPTNNNSHSDAIQEQVIS